MSLSLRFARTLAPCLIACAQAFNPAATGTADIQETLAYATAPVAGPEISSVHKLPVAVMSYADWRRRQLESRAAVEPPLTYTRAATPGFEIGFALS